MYKTEFCLNNHTNGRNTNIPFPFGIDDAGNYGYIKDGADSVTPFRGGHYEQITTFSNRYVINSGFKPSAILVCWNYSVWRSPSGGGIRFSTQPASYLTDLHGEVVTLQVPCIDTNNANGSSSTFNVGMKITTNDTGVTVEFSGYRTYDGIANSNFRIWAYK